MPRAGLPTDFGVILDFFSFVVRVSPNSFLCGLLVGLFVDRIYIDVYYKTC